MDMDMTQEEFEKVASLCIDMGHILNMKIPRGCKLTPAIIEMAMKKGYNVSQSNWVDHSALMFGLSCSVAFLFGVVYGAVMFNRK
jgi:hypothetical protein